MFVIGTNGTKSKQYEEITSLLCDHSASCFFGLVKVSFAWREIWQDVNTLTDTLISTLAPLLLWDDTIVTLYLGTVVIFPWADVWKWHIYYTLWRSNNEVVFIHAGGDTLVKKTNISLSFSLKQILHFHFVALEIKMLLAFVSLELYLLPKSKRLLIVLSCFLCVFMLYCCCWDTSMHQTTWLISHSSGRRVNTLRLPTRGRRKTTMCLSHCSYTVCTVCTCIWCCCCSTVNWSVCWWRVVNLNLAPVLFPSLQFLQLPWSLGKAQQQVDKVEPS